MAEMAIMVAYDEKHQRELEKELGMKVKVEAGDTKLIWDMEEKDEVDTAREAFENLTKKGYTAFSVDKRGETDEKLLKFDPKLEKIILIPPMKGG